MNNHAPTPKGIYAIPPERRLGGSDVKVVVHRANGSTDTITVQCRIDNHGELEYYKNGGVLHYVLRSLAA